MCSILKNSSIFKSKIITLTFADEQTYRIHERDLTLFANSGIWDILEITDVPSNIHVSQNTHTSLNTHVSQNTYTPKNTYIPKNVYIPSSTYTPRNTYIPRYIDTFPIFMWHLRGYPVTLKYLLSFTSKTIDAKTMDIKTLIGMIIADNAVYKIHSMNTIIEDLAYIVCPKTLKVEQLINAFNRKDANFKRKSEELLSQISEIEDSSDIHEKLQYMPHRYLVKQLVVLQERKKYEDFKQEVDMKLPMILIELIKMISSVIEKPLSKNFEANIKQRIRNDPELANELYGKLNELGVQHSVSALVSCFSSFAFSDTSHPEEVKN